MGSSGDVVTETSTIATQVDTVRSSITYTLGANVENLTLTGTAAINGTGNSLNNQLTGNAAANTLTGGAGNDILIGGSGGDRLTGGTGNDTLELGSDTNQDTLIYANGNGSDTIQQFVRGAGGDLLSFSNIPAIDVVTVGTKTEFRQGDGIGSNAGFGTGELLASLQGTTGFNAANINSNLAASNTAQFWFT